ncbi:hypothetical protein [Microbacterium sp. XT11]|uniref:hypothetical protein n=1 Tax=Microbacterium sp. XT11 TaxID=367477 RepID=UPI0008378100|nr:hypothetical protein [Microbacterium sp. XT11]
MPAIEHEFRAVTRINGGDPLSVSSGHTTFDETWAPHIRGSLRVPLGSVDNLDAIDPRKPQRVTIATTESGYVEPVERTIDLGLRSRRIDYLSGELELELASDEALLQDHSLLATTPNKGARAFESSLRAVCDWALSQVPSILRNLEPNSRGLSTGNLAPYGPRFGWARSFVTTGSPAPGAPATVVRFTSPESGSVSGRGVDSYGNPDLAAPGTSGGWLEGPRVNPGQTITISRFIRLFVGKTTWVTRVRFHNGAGAWVGSTMSGAVVEQTLANNWARPSWTGVVPAGAKYVAISTVMAGATALTTSTLMDITGVMTEVTDKVRPWHELVLQPDGINDRDITAQWDAVNLVRNGDARNDITGWSIGSASTSIAHNTGAGVGGTTGYVAATQSGAQGAVWTVPPEIGLSVSEGDMLTASCYVRHDGAAQSQLLFRWYDQDGAAISTRGGTSLTLNSAWQRLTVTAVAPARAVKGAVYVALGSSAAGKTWALDKAMVSEGPIVEDYFDGYTTNTENYTYTFEGTAAASASRRTATPERLPEIFNWNPGQSLWDFLTPLVESSGLRLWCDESRLWRLSGPGDVLDVPSISAQSGDNGNMLDGTDELSRDGDEWADGVVIHHRWTDGTGKTREAYDIAGTSGKVLTVERDSAYPGPGAAAYTLQRIRGRGRTQTLQLLKNTGARPNALTYSTTPGSPTLYGRATAVTLDLQSGVVDVTTRDNTLNP